LTEAGAAPGATSAAPLKGRVLTRDNQIDAATGTLRLKAVFDNADERLLPGQSVMVRLPVRVLKDVLLMPATAVQPGLRGDMVWRIKGAPEGRPQAEAVWVDVVWRDDDQVAVRAGLAEGDQVVVDGQSRLKPGAGVRVMTPAEPTPGGGGAS
jgi:RND family efflux transporter MFP subunit